MDESIEGGIDLASIEELANGIDALARSATGGISPMVVDALAEAWRNGLGSTVGREALVLAARRGTTVVCCPLGRMEPTAPILPGGIGIGMAAAEALKLLGDPHRVEHDGTDAIWLHALPSTGGEGEHERDETPYAVRQAAWKRPDASPDDPPFAPLAAGERMFRFTTLAQGVVVAVGVAVRSEYGLRGPC